MVDAFVVAAEEDEVWGGGELSGEGLFEEFSLGGEEDDLGLGLAELADGGEDWFRFHEHSGAAAAEVVVCFFMFSGGPLAEVVGADGDEVGVLGAFDDAFAEWGEGNFGEEGEDVDLHLGLRVWVLGWESKAGSFEKLVLDLEMGFRIRKWMRVMIGRD